MDTEFDLNISWLNDLQNADLQEKEAMDTLRVSFIYVNVHREIHKIISETHDLEENGDVSHSSSSYLSSSYLSSSYLSSSYLSSSYLSKEYVHSVLSQKIQLEKSHYKFMDGFLFHIDLDFSDIGLESSFQSSFVSPVSIVHDIPIPLSLPLFHSTNCLFFIFHEIPVCKKPSLHISDSIVIQPDSFIRGGTHKHRSLVKHTRKRKIVV
jgi:hypothetical protein